MAVAELESIVGGDGVRPPDEYAVDGQTPRAAVAPGSYQEVAAVMRCAHAEGLAVIPRGAGSHVHIGNTPARYDLALDLRRLNAIVEYEPADMTVTCQAGISLAALRSHLAPHGQLAPLGAFDAQATVGGILAANAYDATRYAYGTARDFTIGMRVVTADGRLTRAGGRVVKNVAGYDLCKAYVGSLGTLGVIVEASFKLAPLPRAERAAVAAFDAPAAACALAGELRRRGLSVRSLQLLNRAAAEATALADGPYTLAVDLAGSAAAVERSWRELEALADVRALDAPPDVAGAVVLAQSVLLCKASVLPTRLPALIESLQEAAEPPRVLALPGAGVCYAGWPEPGDVMAAMGRVIGLASEAGGSLVVERCPAEVKRGLDVFGEPPPSFALMRRLKEELDPKGVLSPGRFLGRL